MVSMVMADIVLTDRGDHNMAAHMGVHIHIAQAHCPGYQGPMRISVIVSVLDASCAVHWFR